MGSFGREKLKLPCHKQGHRWMRLVKCSDDKVHAVPVGLSLPLPTDFCLHCKNTREKLEPVL